MDESIPLPSLFLYGSAIPEVLVELPISEARQLCVEVAHKVKHHDGKYLVHQDNRCVETFENLGGRHTVLEQVCEGQKVRLVNFVDNRLYASDEKGK